MNIIIVGAGKVGEALCQELSQVDHNVTLVDTDEMVIDNLINKYDVNGLVGNGANVATLQEVAVEYADIFIATTDSDEVNIIACTLAKKLGAKHTISRVRNPEYSQQFEIMKSQLGISLMINPELSAAREIARTVRYASSLSVQPLANTRVSLVEMEIQSDSILVNMPLHDFRQRFGSVLVCIIKRGEKVFIPSGNDVLMNGDKIYFAGQSKDTAKFNRQIKQPDRLIKSVMLVGGGKITHYLLPLLEHNHMEVKVIELDENRAECLAHDYKHARVIHSDGTNPDVLQEQGLSEYDAFIALTGVDEENLILGLYASKQGVKKVITKLSRVNLLKVVDSHALKTIVTPKQLVANEIIQFVRSRANAQGSNIEALYRVADAKVEVLLFKVADNCQVLNMSLQQMSLKKNVLITCIIRKGKIMFPNGQDMLQPEDRVIVMTTHTGFTDIEHILEK
ncbi:Trk system potassium transporter TrkA [Carnobacteriaceae bacterium zg-ZUI252]|nr:Trk system potassium transporter TrkA [Carnobacteriaceae bacterium zg-ZUI252]MBS4769621.1 Trk system potassium transporter TrkA [Carnobacteriaceae bacterium zg-ZUI240]QTU83081.1 Trk system potassium transporter TrkA [Carnobacteriaceae bacterium zg-C25]